MEKLIISDVKVDSNIVQINVNGVVAEAGATGRVFRALSDENINIDMILQTACKDEHIDLIFTIRQDDAEEAIDILNAQKRSLKFSNLDINRNIAKITLSGAGLMSHSDIVPRVLSCFHYSNAPTDVISTSEIAIKVFTDQQKTKRVVEKIRDEFVDYGL